MIEEQLKVPKFCEIVYEMEEKYRKYGAHYLKSKGVSLFEPLSGRLHITVGSITYNRNIDVFNEWVAHGFFIKKNMRYTITDEGLEICRRRYVKIDFSRKLMSKNLISGANAVLTLISKIFASVASIQGYLQ